MIFGVEVKQIVAFSLTYGTRRRLDGSLLLQVLMLHLHSAVCICCYSKDSLHGNKAAAVVFSFVSAHLVLLQMFSSSW